MQTKMGMGGDVNGCGLCAKYSLFIANFVMFVSVSSILSLNDEFSKFFRFSFSFYRLAVQFYSVWAYGH